MQAYQRFAVLLLSVATGLASARTYNIVTQMWHEKATYPTGYAVGGTWRSVWNRCNGCNGFFPSSGPGLTDLPAQRDIIATTKYCPTVNPGQTMKFQWQTYNGVGNTVITQKQYDFTPANAPGCFDAYGVFQVPFGHSFQLRTRYWGGGTLDQYSIQILPETENLFYEINAISQQYHEMGRASGFAWTADPALDGIDRFMTYGPYWNLDGLSTYFVLFRVAIENISGSNDVIAQLDVTGDYNGDPAYVLASYDARRSHFTANNVYQNFILKVNTSAALTGVQCRVRFKATAVTKVINTKVFKADSYIW